MPTPPAEVLGTLTTLGGLTGRETEAAAARADADRRLAAVAAAVADRPRPRRRGAGAPAARVGTLSAGEAVRLR